MHDQPGPAVAGEQTYELGEQVGHLLRRANQRHKAIFAAEMPVRLPPTQFAALVKLLEEGELSQNRLGRLTAMDSATIAGVVSRLTDRGFVSTIPSESDNRMISVRLTAEGREFVVGLLGAAVVITDKTLAVLRPEDRPEALRILKLLAADTDD